METGIDPLIVLRLKTVQKIGVILGILAVIVGGYYYFFLNDRLQKIAKIEKEVKKQEQSIISKRKQLTRLPELRKKLAALKIREARLARKLPSKKEIPVLLTNISNAGHEQGLEFLLFAPQPEIERELYAEVPVSLRVRGPFHETVLFFNQVAKLSRIVTVSHVVMTPGTKGLETTAQATTYRFLEQSDDAE